MAAPTQPPDTRPALLQLLAPAGFVGALVVAVAAGVIVRWIMPTPGTFRRSR